MTEAECKNYFGTNGSKFANAVAAGFNDYHGENVHTSHKHSARTRANMIHDNIVNRAKQLGIPSSQFRFIRGLPRNLFDVGQKVLVQFKKLKRNLLSSNYPTQLHLALEEQNKVISLPGIPAALPLVTVGYVASRDNTSILGIFVTYVEDRKLRWAFPLQVAQTNILAQPNEQSAESQKRKRARARAKGIRQQDSADAAAGV